ncbi:MAG: NAD(P)-dependent oxidoreductase [Geminicoccaceae bacterium]
MQRVLFHYQAGERLTRRLRALAADGLDVRIVAPEDADGLARELSGTEILWHALAPVTAELIEAAPRLRLIQKWGVGLNTIDLAAAQARGIRVANMPGTNTRAVVELTLLLMLASLRRLAEVDPALRRGRWAPPLATMEALGELAGRRVGLVGMGAVPQMLAPILAAMAAEPVYWSRTENPDAPARYLPLAELLATSDIVSLHLPLTEDTTGLVDVRAIKPGAILVNTARGGLVDEPALIEALRAGRLGAAGLDVFEAEPIDPENPLLALPNVIVTPHLAWLTGETLERSLEVARQNALNMATGEPLLFRVA